MQLAADAVVFLAGIPLAGLLVLDGLASHRAAEIAAGVVLAVLLGGPSIALSIRARLRDAGRRVD